MPRFIHEKERDDAFLSAFWSFQRYSSHQKRARLRSRKRISSSFPVVSSFTSFSVREPGEEQKRYCDVSDIVVIFRRYKNERVGGVLGRTRQSKNQRYCLGDFETRPRNSCERKQRHLISRGFLAPPRRVTGGNSERNHSRARKVDATDDHARREPRPGERKWKRARAGGVANV